MREVGARTYFSVVTFKTRNWRDLTLFLSIFPLKYQGGRVMIPLFGT